MTDQINLNAKLFAELQLFTALTGALEEIQEFLEVLKTIEDKELFDELHFFAYEIVQDIQHLNRKLNRKIIIT